MRGGQRLLQPRQAFLKMPAGLPEGSHGRGQPQSQSRLAVAEPELQSGTEVVMFTPEPVEPRLLLRLPQERGRRFTQGEKEIRMPGPGSHLAAVAGELLGSERAYGLQHPERW